jgi:outer membrane protein
MSLEVALAPDSNINRATRSDALGTVLGDFKIDKNGKARSGTGYAVRTQAYRRLPLGEGDASILLRASGFADLYREPEFNDIALDFAAGPELQLGRGRLSLELGATQRWFGQRPFQRAARASASLSHPLGRRALVRVNASAAIVDNRFNDLQDGKTYSVQLGLERALWATTGVAATVTLDRQKLRDPGYSTKSWRGGLTAWDDLGRMTITAGAEFGRLRADERLMLFPDKRSERYWRFFVGATFRQMQFRGFAPVVRLSMERNRSTIEFYDYKRTRTEFGFARAF